MKTVQLISILEDSRIGSDVKARLDSEPLGISLEIVGVDYSMGYPRIIVAVPKPAEKKRRAARKAPRRVAKKSRKRAKK